MQKGIIKARRDVHTSHGGIWLILADETEIARLQSLKTQPKGWIYHSQVKKVH